MQHVTVPRATWDAMREALEKSLQSMVQVVQFRETGRGRPPEQTCTDAIAEASAALTAANAVRQPQFVGCAYYESNGACCESGEPCKADVQNNAVVQAQWHLPEKREIGEFDPKKSDSTYFRGLGWNECIDAMSSMQPPAAP